MAMELEFPNNLKLIADADDYASTTNIPAVELT